MTRPLAIALTAAALVPAAPSAPVAAQISDYEGTWTATFQPDGRDAEYCQMGAMSGVAAILDGAVRLRTLQNGMTHRLEGSVDPDGNLEVRGIWRPRPNSNIAVNPREYTLKGKFSDGRFAGLFYGTDRTVSRSDGSACYATVTMTRYAAAAGATTGAYDGRWAGRIECGRDRRGVGVPFVSAPTEVVVRNGRFTYRRRDDGSGASEIWRGRIDGGGRVAIDGEFLRGRLLSLEFEGRVADDVLTAQGRRGGRNCTLTLAREVPPDVAETPRETAAASAFDGAWTATLRADGRGGRGCRFRRVRGPVTIDGGRVRLTLRQRGTDREFRGRVDADGNLRASGDWQVGAGRVPPINHLLRGQLDDGRLVGMFYTADRGGGRGCFATFVMARGAMPPPAPPAAAAPAAPEPPPTAAAEQRGAAPGDGATDAMKKAQRMLAKGAISDAVAFVNGAGDLSMTQQQTLFKALKGRDIAKKLKSSDVPVARKIGRTLEQVAKGKEISQRQMKVELAALGISGRSVLTYLALFERARKNARDEMFRLAIAELRRRPQVAHVAVRAPVARPRPKPGRKRKVALLIGVDRYRKPIPSLRTPTGDVDAIGRRLRRKFGYETRILKNATKRQIEIALQELVDTLGERDSVVIMYAGHGYILESNGVGYWLPADAATNSAKQWISNKNISKVLKGIRARRIILIADSCYSGSLLAGEKTYASGDFSARRRNFGDKRSVVIMTSGGEEPVRDDGGAGHSVFALQLMNGLESVESDRLGAQLYRDVKARVAELAPQVPHYGGVVSAGHQTGTDYVFRVTASAAAAAATTEGPSLSIDYFTKDWRLQAGAAAIVAFVVVAGGVALRRRRPAAA